MQYLKADTEVKVVIGPVVAVGDGFTPVTTLALTGGSAADEAEILKHDAGSVTDISSNTFAALTSADGYYNLTITTAQLDTEGMLTVLINDDSLCLPVRHDFMVVSANVYDSLFSAAATDYLKTDIIQVSGTAESLPTDAQVTTIDTEVGLIQADLDIITGSDGVTLATTQGNYTPSTAAALSTMQGNVTDILADTNELQGDDVPGLIAALDTVVDRVEADTQSLQADDIPGLITALDVLIDAIKAKTDDLTFTKTDELDVNIQSVNGATVTGDGTSGSEWGP